MRVKETIGSFLDENKQLVKEWLEERLTIYKLKFLRSFSGSAGFLVWVIVLLLLSFLFIVFLGITAGFWLSGITGSYTQGFGLVGLSVLLLIVILTIFRKALFVNPIIRVLIKQFFEVKNPKSDNEK